MCWENIHTYINKHIWKKWGRERIQSFNKYVGTATPYSIVMCKNKKMDIYFTPY